MPASPLDLCTTSACAAYLAAGGLAPTAAQSAQLQALVTAASVEIQRELHRVIPAADYDETLVPTPGRPDRGEPAVVRLGRYPVNGSPLVYGGRTAALTVTNADRATNQLAYVAFDAAGDPDVQVTYPSVTLTRVASGVATANTIAFAGRTVQGVADAVNALGGGWSAAAQSGTPSPALFPAALLAGAREPKDALGAPCVLSVFATPLACSVDRAAGLVSFPLTAGGWNQGSGPWQGGGEDGCDGRRGEVRCLYNAGYATVPAAYQGFCAEVVKAMLERLTTDTTLQSETAKDYSYTARAVLHQTALQTVLTSLQKYKDFSL